MTALEQGANPAFQDKFLSSSFVKRVLCCFGLLCCLASCATLRTQTPTGIATEPVLHPGRAVMDDSYELPVTIWGAARAPRAVVLAIHGFNDYRNAFAGVGPVFADRNITTYGYDQRGFGETAQRGIWPGGERLVADARIMADLLCSKYPDVPLFLLGESMGGAVAIDMANEVACVQGVILIAPAVWGWRTMPFWQRWVLKLTARIAPAYRVTGQSLRIQASDNTDMLDALGRDPLVIKKSRLDTLVGLTDLMEKGLLGSPRLNKPTLILYGENDEIIPARPVCEMLEALPDPAGVPWRLVLYRDGYHMLTRDLQADAVLKDMLSWLHDSDGQLKSGEEVLRDSLRLETLCGKIKQEPMV